MVKYIFRVIEIDNLPEPVKVFDENWEPFRVEDQLVGIVDERVRRCSSFSWLTFRRIRSRRILSTTSPTHPLSPSYKRNSIKRNYVNFRVCLEWMNLISRSHLFPAMIIGTRLGVLIFLLPRNDCWFVVCRPPMWHLVSMICDRRRATSSKDSRLSTLKTKRNRSPGQQKKNN
jgi:hypothetical protein